MDIEIWCDKCDRFIIPEIYNSPIKRVYREYICTKHNRVLIRRKIGVDFGTFETKDLVTITACLNKSFENEKSEAFKGDIIEMLKVANNELSKRIEIFEKKIIAGELNPIL